MIQGTKKIYLGNTGIKKVMLGGAMIHPAVVSTEQNVHYDTGANTYQGWDRYNLYYYHDILKWSDGTTTYENIRSDNTLTRANAFTEADTLKSTGISFWRSGWDKYRSDIYQTLRTREDGYQEWIGSVRNVSILVQSNAYTEARTHKSIGTSFWPSGWDKYRTDIYQILRTAFDGYQEWIGAEEQISVLVESNAYSLGGYYHESNTSTVCVNYGVAPYQTGYHRIMARNRIRFDGYQEVNDRYTEGNWQIVENNVQACGYSPTPVNITFILYAGSDWLATKITGNGYEVPGGYAKLAIPTNRYVTIEFHWENNTGWPPQDYRTTGSDYINIVDRQQYDNYYVITIEIPANSPDGYLNLYLS